MAKELPYFRFTVQDWQNKDISLESYEMKGLFIDVCGFYWINDCNTTLAILKKKFSNAISLLDELVNLDIIKHEKKHDKVEIDFLNKQYDLLSEKRKLRQDAGSKGGNAKAMLKQKHSYKDKDKDKDNNKEKDNIEFSVFWELYNHKVGSKTKSEKKWKLLKDEQRIKIIDTLPNFLKTITDKKFQPHALTYLNNERWEDVLTEIKRDTKGSIENNQW